MMAAAVAGRLLFIVQECSNKREKIKKREAGVLA